MITFPESRTIWVQVPVISAPSPGQQPVSQIHRKPPPVGNGGANLADSDTKSARLALVAVTDGGFIR